MADIARFLSVSLCLTLILNAADLPVRQVTLYKHGVGFFEREGSVPPGEEARLDFKNSEMNDVLKSLIVTGAGISAVRYDSNATLEQRLEKYPFSIGNGELLSTFLDRLKGAKVEIKVADKPLSGAILGSRALKGGADEKLTEQVTLLLDSGDVSNFDLAAISSMHLLDAQLQQQLKDYLATIAQAKAKDKRSIYLASTSTGARDLRLSYIAPTAIWKSSYRLSLGAGKSILEGWAIVDNTSDEDWTSVRLSVVSGRPISFISLLDTPRFGNRQVAELPEDSAAGPVVYSGGIAAPPPAPHVPGAGLNLSEQMPVIAGNFSKSVQVNASAPEVTRSENLQSTVTAATGATLGELFEYNFALPVTIGKNQSAMLPFLQDPIGARKLLIFQEGQSEHPVNAAEVTNNTGKTLDGGPITVFDGGAYAGEALVETLKTNDKRLIGYAVDFGTRVTSAYGASNSTVRQLKAIDGVIEITSAQETERTYNIQNVDQKAKSLIVEQPGIDQFTVLSPTPTEKTATAYRFEVPVPASSSTSLTVKQERILFQSTSVSNATPGQLTEILQNKKLGASGQRQVQAILDLKRQITAAGSESDSAKSKLRDLTEEQTRLRQNIGSLNQVSGQEAQVRAYAGQLSTNESAMAALRDRRDAADQRKLTLEDQLSQSIARLNF